VKKRAAEARRLLSLTQEYLIVLLSAR